MARQVSYKTIKVYLAGIHLEHLERGFEDPTKDELMQLLCTGIKRSQGAQTHTCLPTPSQSSKHYSHSSTSTQLSPLLRNVYSWLHLLWLSMGF